MSTRLTFRLEDEDALRDLGAIERAVRVNFATKAATLAKEYVVEAGRAVTPKLGEPSKWRIYGYGDSYVRHVRATKGIWWAHFLAGGTRSHGPRKAPALVFKVDGHVVRVSRVKGIPATHFDKKATDRVRHRTSELIRDAIADARRGQQVRI